MRESRSYGSVGERNGNVPALPGGDKGDKGNRGNKGVRGIGCAVISP